MFFREEFTFFYDGRSLLHATSIFRSLGGDETSYSRQTVLGMCDADAGACLVLVIVDVMVGAVAPIHDLPLALLDGKNHSSPFGVQLGGDGELWGHPLLKEKKIFRMDEVVWKKKSAFVRLG